MNWQEPWFPLSSPHQEGEEQGNREVSDKQCTRASAIEMKSHIHVPWSLASSNQKKSANAQSQRKEVHSINLYNKMQFAHQVTADT